MAPKKNPAWSTRAIAESYDFLEEHVPPAWLPRLDSVRGRGKTKMEVELHEYGCGAYGCVLATLDPAVVMKITTDSTEAEFATMFSSYTEAVVRYHKVVKLPNEREGRPMFLVWRESAQHVGELEKVVGRKAAAAVDKQHEAAQKVYSLGSEGDVTSKAYDAAVEKWRAATGEMGRIPELEFMARGLLSLLWEHGVFLGDIHAGNVGLVTRDGKELWVVTDPGHTLAIDQDDDKPKQNPHTCADCEGDDPEVASGTCMLEDYDIVVCDENDPAPHENAPQRYEDKSGLARARDSVKEGIDHILRNPPQRARGRQRGRHGRMDWDAEPRALKASVARTIPAALAKIPVVYSGRLTRAAARTMYLIKKGTRERVPDRIEINSKVDWPEGMIHATLVHEYAHAATCLLLEGEETGGHGPEWSAVMVGAGEKPAQYVTEAEINQQLQGMRRGRGQRTDRSPPPTFDSPSSVRCPRCSASLPRGSRFCGVCGSQLRV